MSTSCRRRVAVAASLAFVADYVSGDHAYPQTLVYGSLISGN